MWGQRGNCGLSGLSGRRGDQPIRPSPIPPPTLSELMGRVENIVSPGRRIFPQAVAKAPRYGARASLLAHTH